MQIKNCKSETLPTQKKISQNIPNKDKSIGDYTINNIDKTAVEGQIEDQNDINRLKNLLSKAFDREVERPYMWDIFTSSNDTLLQFHRYKNFMINNTLFKSYYITIYYEDAKYQCILLVNEALDNIYNSMIVYEDLISEEKYQRISRILGNKVILEFTREKISKNLEFQVNNGLFLDYFDTQNIDRQWGNKEVIHSNAVYEYQLKGKTNGHLKNGYWIEKRYSTDYGKTVIEDGNYMNGIKNGEWNYSPDGPVDKIDIFKDGKLVKTSYP